MMEELKMKKIKLMMMALLVSVVAVGCSSTSNGETNTPATEEATSNVSLKEIATQLGEKEYIIMPLEISDEEAKEIYHVNTDVVEDYGIAKTARMPGLGFAFMVKAKEGKLEEAKAIVEQVKADQVGNAFYPDEVEAAQSAEILVNGNYVALFILNDEVKADAIKLYEDAIK